jgi:hypothetical protein
MITRELKRIWSKIYIKNTIFFGICIYKFIAPKICLRDSSLSGDTSLSPTKGRGPFSASVKPYYYKETVNPPGGSIIAE